MFSQDGGEPAELNDDSAGSEGLDIQEFSDADSLPGDEQGVEGQR